MKYVIKRNGTKVVFDKSKIFKAIMKAMTNINHVNMKLAQLVAEKISEIPETLSVEQIQDKVEEYLMSSDYKDVARAYIVYRDAKAKERAKNKKFEDAIAEKLTAKNVQNQNANVDEMSFGGRKGEAAAELMRQYALEHCMSEMARKNHEGNMIYIHDLDSYAVGQHNCCRRNTQFITSTGVSSFEEHEDGDEVEVLTHTGCFRKAIVQSYGVQKLNKITFEKQGVEEIQYFTSNHRWILKDGVVVTDLQISDVLYKAPNIKNVSYTVDNNDDSCWRVKSIEPSIEEEVWCLYVKGDHSFVLPNGIVTGNCITVPFDDLLAKGFNTRQTDVRPANSINTAFQLVAVLFQLQSLQQFG